MLVDASTDANTKTHTQTACAHRLRINNNNNNIGNSCGFYSVFLKISTGEKQRGRHAERDKGRYAGLGPHDGAHAVLVH